jgi:thiol-disulfide isomerase/thioredoxin
MPTLLVFTNTRCAACETLFDDLVSWERRYSGRFVTLVINRGSVSDASQIIKNRGVTKVVADEIGSVISSFGVAVTPSALMIANSGRVGTAINMGSEAISGLITEQLSLAPLYGLGDENPGGYLAESVEANKQILLFWDPGCGFCQSMLPTFRQWEAIRDSQSPNVTIVFKGNEREANQLGLSSPVILDEIGNKMTIYGIRGTPMAVAVDRHGLAASPIAIGSDEIFRLLAMKDL